MGIVNPQEMLEKAKKVHAGLMQFENAHQPIPQDDGTIICPQCEVDFPCDRMFNFMLLQALATLSSQIPSGNMAALMSRFSGGQK